MTKHKVTLSKDGRFLLNGKPLPAIFPLDRVRGTLLIGNVIKINKGTRIVVGDGHFKGNK